MTLYDRIHDWLRHTYGKATTCEFCHQNDKKKYEYALKQGLEHDFKRENYLQLCTSCHRRYDWTDEKSKAISIRNSGPGNARWRKPGAFRGRHHTEEIKRKISESNKRTKNRNKLKSLI